MKKTYYYTVRELSKERFESTDLYRFFQIYRQIFMNKAEKLALDSKADILDVARIQNSGSINIKITQHVLNSNKKAMKENTSFSPEKRYKSLFSLDWYVQMESSNIIEMRSMACREDYQEPTKLIIKYPELATRDGISWFVSRWKKFTVFFDSSSLKERISSNLEFTNKLRITVGDKVTFNLGYAKNAKFDIKKKLRAR